LLNLSQIEEIYTSALYTMLLKLLSPICFLQLLHLFVAFLL
jgi:hypothetical protein